MPVEIISTPFHKTIHGFAGTAINKDYAGTAFRLMDKMWKIVKSNQLKNKGMNIWVYENNHAVFAGVELEEKPDPAFGLEEKTIDLNRYGYYKHIGPYQLIKQAGTSMNNELEQKGFKTGLPYIEIYGHWTNDESKLETELLVNLV